MNRVDLQRTGYFSSDSPTAKSDFLWKYQVQKGGISDPIYSNGIIYFCSNSGVHGVDPETGEQKLRLDEDIVTTTPVVASGVLFYGTQDNVLHAYDTEAHDELWDASIGSITSSPVIDTGIIYVGTEHGLVSINAINGETLWKSDAFLVGPAAISDETVFFGSQGGLIAADLKTGEKKWSVRTAGITSSPAVANDSVYFVSDDGLLRCSNRKTGKEAWRSNIGPVVLGFGSPAVYAGSIYVSTANGIVAIDGSSGSILWEIKNSGSLFSEPAIAGDAVLFASENVFHAVNASDGKTLFEYKNLAGNKRDYVSDSPVVAGSKIIINLGFELVAF